MSLPLSPQTRVHCLLCLVVGLSPFISGAAPSLQNVSITPAGENSIAVLRADINSGGGGQMTLRVDWGDGTGGSISYTNTTTNFAIGHYYEDDNPFGTPADLYTVSLSLSNTLGVALTNLGVVVSNVPPRLALTVNSPIEPASPATLRGVEITEFPVPTKGSGPHGITIGPDGNIWFTEQLANRIGRITTNGAVTEFPVGGGARDLWGIATGADNRLWFCARGSSQIGAITTNGVVTMYPIPRAANDPAKSPYYIVRRGGHMWYSDLGYRISRIMTNGVITEWVHQAGVNPWGITVGADNHIWFTAYFSDTVNRLDTASSQTTTYNLTPFGSPTMMTRGPDNKVWFTEFQEGKIGSITTNGVLEETFIGRTGPYGITTGPDGAMWFTEQRAGSSNAIGRLTLDKKLSRYGLSIFSQPMDILTGPDNALWFTLTGRDRIGRLRHTTAGNVVLSGELNDPGYLDTHIVQINWGDGSPVETLNLAAGIASFHVAHTYSGSQPAHVITVNASDDDSGTSQASTIVVINAMHLTSVNREQNGEVRLRGEGANGRTITIESSSDLRNWSSVGTATSVSNRFEFVHPNAPGTTRFYRGKLP